MSDSKKRVIPIDKLIDYPESRYKAAVFAIKGIRNLVDIGLYNDISRSYSKVSAYALSKVLNDEFEEVKEERS